MSLSVELSKPEYQTGTYAERLSLLHSKTQSVVGRIELGNLKKLEAIIATGLWRDKMKALKDSANLTLADDNASHESKQLAQIKLQVVAGFHEAIAESKLANKAPFELGGHTINMADPDVQQTFSAAQMPGIDLITILEVQKVMQLATYQRQLFPDATLRDVVEHFEPALTDIGDWAELNYSGGRLALTLTQSLPEPSLVRIVACESIDGENWTEWQKISHFYKVGKAGFYLADIPRSQLQRRIRWRGEDYKIIGTVVGI